MKMFFLVVYVLNSALLGVSYGGRSAEQRGSVVDGILGGAFVAVAWPAVIGIRAVEWGMADQS